MQQETADTAEQHGLYSEEHSRFSFQPYDVGRFSDLAAVFFFLL